MSKDQDEKASGKIIENHEYDGIQELDNPLPGWWLATFYITIVFAVIYGFYYLLGPGPKLSEEFELDRKNIEFSMNSSGKNQGPTEKELNAALTDAGLLAKGKESYSTKCASCHGQSGEGGIGPNLTDRFWIHGSKILEIAKSIKEGIADKGMPAWGGMLAAPEIISLTVYVEKLKGTKPSNGKAPQGIEIKD